MLENGSVPFLRCSSRYCSWHSGQSTAAATPRSGPRVRPRPAAPAARPPGRSGSASCRARDRAAGSRRAPPGRRSASRAGIPCCTGRPGRTRPPGRRAAASPPGRCRVPRRGRRPELQVQVPAAAGRPIPLPASLLGTVIRTPAVTVPRPSAGRDRQRRERGGIRFSTVTSAGSRAAASPGRRPAPRPGRAGRMLARSCGRRADDDAPGLAALADHDPARARGLAGPDHDLVADAGVGGQRVPGRLVGMHQARAGRGVVSVSARRQTRRAGRRARCRRRRPARRVRPSRVHPVGRVAELRLLDDAEQVHGDRAQRGRLGGLACSGSSARLLAAWCSQLARLASGSVDQRNASAGPAHQRARARPVAEQHALAGGDHPDRQVPGPVAAAVPVV